MNKKELIKLIEDTIADEKADLGEFNGDFIRGENSMTELDECDVDELTDVVDNWEFDSFQDVAYQVGRIRGLEWLLDKVKEGK